MKKLKTFLEKWMKFNIYETDDEGIYHIYAGISQNGEGVDLSIHGFNLYFGNSKNVTNSFEDYGFQSVESFKKAAVFSLYYISLINAEEIVGGYIVDSLRKGKPLRETEIQKYIWEGISPDCPGKWSVFIDLRALE